MYPTLKALVSAFTLPIARDSSFIGWSDTNYNFLVNTVFEFVKSQNSDKPNHVYSIFRSSFWTLIIMASVVSGGFFLHNNTSEFLHRLPSINVVTFLTFFYFKKNVITFAFWFNNITYEIIFFSTKVDTVSVKTRLVQCTV